MQEKDSSGTSLTEGDAVSVSASDQRPHDATRHATQACGEWLAACLRLGWRRDDLDLLESLWWKYHDARGNLIDSGNQVPPEQADATRRSEAK